MDLTNRPRRRLWGYSVKGTEQMLLELELDFRQMQGALEQRCREAERRAEQLEANLGRLGAGRTEPDPDGAAGEDDDVIIKLEEAVERIEAAAQRLDVGDASREVGEQTG